jgi:hypothetical protein
VAKDSLDIFRHSVALSYGFAAVRASLANMKRLHAKSPVSRLATRAFFRLSDWSPWLRKRTIDTGG